MATHSIMVLILCCLARGQDSDIQEDSEYQSLLQARRPLQEERPPGVPKLSDPRHAGPVAVSSVGLEPSRLFRSLDSMLLEMSAAAALQNRSALAQMAGKGGLLGSVISLTPDHAAVLVTVAAGLGRGKAFLVGASWGVGHSLGMIVVYVLFLYTNQLVKPELWELIGNYGAGVMLMLLGGFFALREDTFVEDRKGEFVAKPCACCHGHGSGHHVPASGSFWRLMSGVLLGALQGLCCPTCLVTLGVFSSVAAAPHSHLQDAIFLLCYTLSACITSGLVAALWTSLIVAATGSWLSFRTVYRACCAITVTVGIVWLVANMSGYMHFVDYGDAFAKRIASK